MTAMSLLQQPSALPFRQSDNRSVASRLRIHGGPTGRRPQPGLPAGPRRTLGLVEGPSFDIDLDALSMTIYASGGRRGKVDLPPGCLEAEKNARRFGYRAIEEVLLIELPDGSIATVELDLGRSAADLLAGRAIVYLDQN